MKIKLTGTIGNMTRGADRGPQGEIPSGLVGVRIDMKGGVVDDAKTHESKLVEAWAHMTLKAIYADELKFGQKLFITVDTKEQSQEDSALRDMLISARSLLADALHQDILSISPERLRISLEARILEIDSVLAKVK